MNVAIVTETYPPEINGVALTIQNYVRGLASLGHQVTLVRPKQDVVAMVPKGVNQFLVPGMKLPRYPNLRFGFPVTGRLRKMLVAHHVEALYIATEGPLGYAALAAARKLGLYVVSGLHTRFDEYAGHYGLGFAQRSVARYLCSFHNRCHRTLVPTQELAAALDARGYKRISVLERAVDTRRFDPVHRDEALRKEWGLLEDDLAVLYVGRIAAEKNLDLACEAFFAIRTIYPRARFVLVGDGPMLKSIRERHPDFIYAGQRIGADLARHYASADLFLFPSVTETFGNVVVEALASGLPVSAFELAAAARFVAPSENGFLAPANDREAFIKNSVVLAHLSRQLPDLHRNARLSVAGIGMDSITRRYERFLGAGGKEPDLLISERNNPGTAEIAA